MHDVVLVQGNSRFENISNKYNQNMSFRLHSSIITVTVHGTVFAQKIQDCEKYTYKSCIKSNKCSKLRQTRVK